jgi:cation:H+ antiporter
MTTFIEGDCMAEIVPTPFVFDVLVIAISFVALNWASNIAINNAVKVAIVTRFGKTAVGFSLIAFSTSLPELTVAIIAGLSSITANGQSAAPLSVGNVLGSNIVNICVIIGLATFILHFRQLRKTKKSNVSEVSNGINVIPSFAKSELSSIYFGLFISSVIPIILIYVSAATWIIGLALLFIFVGYMYKLSKIRIPVENGEDVSQNEKNRLKRFLLLTILGALGVVLSAYFLVESAVSIASSVGLSQQVIGATIIAFGTSLPELTLDLKSFMRGHPGLAFGDIIGSSFVNITLILGITLVVPAIVGSPVSMDMGIFQNLIIFSIITNLFFWYFLSREKIGWREGAIFLFIYALFLATTLSVTPPQQVPSSSLLPITFPSF